MWATSPRRCASPWRKDLSAASRRPSPRARKKLPKGDVFTVAKIAAIQAAKRTDEFDSTLSSLPLDAVELSFSLKKNLVHIMAEARTTAKTGVEMEALTAVSVAALTIYDMCKAVDKDDGHRKCAAGFQNQKMKIGRVTLSDRASNGVYEDRSGPEIERVLREQFAEEIEFECVLLPDEEKQIETALKHLCGNGLLAGGHNRWHRTIGARCDARGNAGGGWKKNCPDLAR